MPSEHHPFRTATPEHAVSRCARPWLRTVPGLVLLLLALSWAVSAQATRAVRVGVYTFPPLIFEHNGVANGFFVDILREVARREAWELQFVPGTWPECLARLESGEIDLLPSIAFNEERGALYDYPRLPLVLDWATVFRRPDTPLRQFMDLQGRTLAVLDGAAVLPELRELLADFELEARIVLHQDLDAVFRAVRNEEADAVVTTRIAGGHLALAHGLVPTDMIFAPTRLYYAVRKGHDSELLAALDAFIAETRQVRGSVYEQLYQKWLEPAAPDKVPTWLRWVLALLAATCLLLLAFSLSLRALVRRRTLELFTATQRLAESEERYRSLIENAPVGIFQSTPEGRYLSANQQLATMYGFASPEQLMREVNSIAEQVYMHPPDRGQLLELVERDGTAFNHETRRKRRNGEAIWVATTMRAVRDPANGRTLHYDGFATDISLRKRMEEQLARSEAVLQAIVDNTPVGMHFYDLVQGELVFAGANPAAEHLLGIDHAPLVGKSITEAFPMLAETTIPAGYREILATGEPWHVEQVGYEDEQTSGIYEVIAFAVTGSRLAVMFLDITARKQAERDLTNAKREFELIFENSQVGIMLLRGGRNVHRVNQRLADILGYATPAEVRTRTIKQLHLDEERFREFSREHYTKLAQGDQVQVDYQLRRKDGSPIWCALHGRALDPGDLSKGVLWVVDDLTRRKALEDMLVQAKEEAEDANRAKSEFLANMSHEIRTPLNGVMGMLQLMQTTNMAGEQKEFTISALQSCRRLTRLLTDILDLSRIEAGKMPIHSEPMDLGEIMEQVRNLFLPMAREAGVELRLALAPAVPHKVLGDPVRVQQVLSNLVGNALKFTPEGSITVSADPVASMDPRHCRVLFSVADTGIGIPAQSLDRLFTPYSQAEAGRSRNHQGTGLGLSICKRLVQHMGGSITVDSKPGSGTTVYFSIAFGCPAPDQQHPPKPALAAPVHDGRPLQGQKILVAEDDRVSRLVASRLLANAGATVHGVVDGEAALEALRRERFDLALLDVQMPVMDGIEVTRAIRAGEAGAEHQDLPIVAMTAYAMAGDRERFLENGMDGYLPKPVHLEELYAVLAKTLQGR